MTLNELLEGRALPVTLYDTLGKVDRTFIGRDADTNLWKTSTIWFSGADTSFEAIEITEKIVLPNKCTCDIVALMQGGCKCNGI